MIPQQHAFSTEPKAAGLEVRPPVDVPSAVLSWLFVELAVQVPQTETVLL